MSADHEHNHEEHNSFGHKMLLAGGMSTAAVVAAPYIGNLFGIGKTVNSLMMPAFHSASGLAASMNGLLGNVPLVGSYLAAGGLATALTAGVIGVGGMLLGNYIQENYDANSDIPWGKIIKYACLVTSMLIALPSLLTGISVGLSYFTAFTPFATEFNTIIAGTLGSLGMAGMHSGTAMAGISSLLTHFVTCGGAALSAVGAVFLDKDEKIAHSSHEHKHYTTQNSPITMQVESCSPIERGKECQIAFRLLDASGRTIPESEILETHTKKLHLMLIDKTLMDFQHIHPEYDSKTGLFTTSFVPNTQNSYSSWHDFTMNNGEHFVLKNNLSATKGYNVSPSIQHANQASADGINISMEANPPFSAGGDSTMQIKAVDDYGNPVKLSPLLGAYAHLVGFSRDGEHFLHCHPMEENSANNATMGELNFYISPQQAGFTKFFLQIKTDGREVTIPFGQYIQPHAKFSERKNVVNSEKCLQMAMA